MKRFLSIFMMFLICVVFSAPAFAQEAKPLSLEQAIETALSQNRSLLADSYDRQAAQWGTAQSVSSYLPRAYFVSTWSRMDDESIDRANQGYELAKMAGYDTERAAWENMYQSYITIAQPLFNGGKEISAIMAADIARKERSFNLENRRLSIVKQVKTAYFGVLTSEQMLTVAKESVALAEESLKVATARFELGQINRSEVLRWEANLSEAEGLRIEAENTLEGTRLGLANIIGAPLSERFLLEKLTPKQIDQDIGAAAVPNANELPTTSEVAAHPSVKQIDQAVSLAKVDRFSAVGTLLPRANFSYSYFWQTNDTVELDGRESWTAGIQLEIPLFQGLGGIFGIGQTHKSMRKAQSSREDYTRGFLQQLHIARLNIGSAKKRVLAAGKAQKFAEENMTLIKGRHKLGMASNLDLIDAQFSYTRARSDYIRAVSDFYVALADYEYLTAKSTK